ncbi:transposase-like protein [Pedobacter cryoconitis]|uniref:Transposase-like protein n=1 Tax=Pedobacter cryoconitis TaxID=188932 RepID=A0A7W9DN53_9SPHI|nr:IS1595 family transposase [Pedobacter cryoconitis]MBB5623890.1 transposase-like protein [Pedobacter cryoconitis]
MVKVFPTEQSCHQYLAYQRWEGIVECPYDDCKGDKAYVFKDGIRYKCTCCKRIYTAKTNTFMEASKLSTIKWIMAMYLVLHKKGISSVQLAKDIDTCQKTAWFVLQRIRTALGNEEEMQLEGEISLDETFVGGKNKNRHADKKVKQSQGRSFKDKTPVMGMLQEQEYQMIERPHKNDPTKTVIEKVITKESRVICKVIKDTKAESLQPIIKQYVKEGSLLISDEWYAYRGLNTTYDHQVVDHGKGQYQNEAGYSSNSIEGFWSHCKRSIVGIYHKTSRKHLEKYFNEFTFRYNYRNLGVQDQINMVISNMECRLKYKDLIA